MQAFCDTKERGGNDMAGIAEVISNLRKWRALPGYSVERRIDVLLTPYLEEFLSKEMKAPVELVTAEFPLPKLLFEGAAGKNLHVSADFLCLRGGDEPAWILVELKTDSASRRGDQDRAYRACATKEMKDILGAIRSTKRGKKVPVREYRRLIWKVQDAARARRVERIELCYIEPRKGSERRAEDGVVTWSLGLRKLTHVVSPPKGDELWPLLVKLLRGIARSDKARRAVPRSATYRSP